MSTGKKFELKLEVNIFKHALHRNKNVFHLLSRHAPERKDFAARIIWCARVHMLVYSDTLSPKIGAHTSFDSYFFVTLTNNDTHTNNKQTQLGRLKAARAAADEVAAAAPVEEEVEEDQPSAGAEGGASTRNFSKSPSRKNSSKSPGRAKSPGGGGGKKKNKSKGGPSFV